MKQCIIDTCDSKHHTKGYCSKHWHRITRYNDPDVVKLVRRPGELHKATPEYRVYLHMKARCYNPTDGSYKNYGARGIRVCDKWLGTYGYDYFLADMGRRPTSKYSIDRIDNDGNYEPSNCQWATMNHQAVNRRNNNIVPGVKYAKHCNSWHAFLYIDKEIVHSKFFKSYDLAVESRHEAEIKFFGAILRS